MSAPGPYVAELEADGIRHVALDHATRSMAPTEDLRALVELTRRFRELRPAIVHTHNPKPGVYGRLAARLARVPGVVNTVHGLYALPEDPLAKRAVVYGLERVAATVLPRRARAEPRGRRRSCAAWGSGRDKVHLLGNGIDLSRFSARPDGAGAPGPPASRVGRRRRRRRGGPGRPARGGEGLPGGLRGRGGAARDPPARAVRGRRPRGARQGRRPDRRATGRPPRPAPASGSSAPAPTSRTATRPSTSTCSRRSGRASRGRPWRPPPWACRSWRPTSAAAARSSTTASPGCWCPPATPTALSAAVRALVDDPDRRRADGTGRARPGRPPLRPAAPDRPDPRGLRAPAGPPGSDAADARTGGRRTGGSRRRWPGPGRLRRRRADPPGRSRRRRRPRRPPHRADRAELPGHARAAVPPPPVPPGRARPRRLRRRRRAGRHRRRLRLRRPRHPPLLPGLRPARRPGRRGRGRPPPGPIGPVGHRDLALRARRRGRVAHGTGARPPGDRRPRSSRSRWRRARRAGASAVA